jgi:hypothetical protein
MELWVIVLVSTLGAVSSVSLTAFFVLLIRWRSNSRNQDSLQSVTRNDPIPVCSPCQTEAINISERHKLVDKKCVYYAKPSTPYLSPSLHSGYGDAHQLRPVVNESNFTPPERSPLSYVSRPLVTQEVIPVKWLSSPTNDGSIFTSHLSPLHQSEINPQIDNHSPHIHDQYPQSTSSSFRQGSSVENARHVQGIGMNPSHCSDIITQNITLQRQLVIRDSTNIPTNSLLSPIQNKEIHSSTRRKWSGDSQPDLSVPPPRELRVRRESAQQYNSEEDFAFNRNRYPESLQRRNTLQSLEKSKVIEQKPIPNMYRVNMSAPLLSEQSLLEKKGNSPNSQLQGEFPAGVINNNTTQSAANSSHTSLDGAEYYHPSSQILNKYGGRRRNQQHLLNRAGKLESQLGPPTISPLQSLPSHESPQ